MVEVNAIPGIVAVASVIVTGMESTGHDEARMEVIRVGELPLVVPLQRMRPRSTI